MHCQGLTAWKHPHHPWQSWRDRYIKKLKDRPQPYAAPVNGPPTPPADLQTLDMHQLEQSGAPDIRKIRSLFNEKDAKALLDVAGQIMDIRPESVTEAWKAWSESIDVCEAHQAPASTDHRSGFRPYAEAVADILGGDCTAAVSP